MSSTENTSQSGATEKGAIEQLDRADKESVGRPPSSEPSKGEPRPTAPVTGQSDSLKGPSGVANPQDKS